MVLSIKRKSICMLPAMMWLQDQRNSSFWPQHHNMGNICCTETSSDDFKSNGRVKSQDEDYPLQGNNADNVELQHISEREHGKIHVNPSISNQQWAFLANCSHFRHQLVSKQKLHIRGVATPGEWVVALLSGKIWVTEVV